MHIKTSRKSFWQCVTALIGMTLIVGTGSAQTVTIDSAPPLTLRTVDGQSLAPSSISIDPMTGNAQVNTTSNITTCGAGSPALGRTVTVTSPNQASPNGTINVNWVANNFVGATTCSVTLGAGSAVAVPNTPVTGLAHPAISSLSVVLGSAQPASYNFSVQCIDAGGAASNSSITNVANSIGCSDPNIGKWRGLALSPPDLVRDWVTIFGIGVAPFPGPPNLQFTAPLSLGSYDSMRFSVPTTLNVGFRTDIFTFVSGASAEGNLAISVSPCQGDFREAMLVNEARKKYCLNVGGGGGTAINVLVVDNDSENTFDRETCEIVRGRNYFVNTTFGTANSQQTGSFRNGAYCITSECIYKMERRLSRASF